jgi:hypothetical protein
MDREVNLSKIVRLTTDDDNCIWDAQFDEELFIAPQTEIALKSATIAFSSATVVIGLGGGNNQLSIFHDNLQHIIEIPFGTYSPKNTPLLMTELGRLLNGTMTLGEKTTEIGLSYNIALNANQRIEITSLRTQPISITGDDFYSGRNGQGRYWDVSGLETTVESFAYANDGVLKRTVASGSSTVANFDCIAYPDFSFTGGLGVWRTTISSLNAPTDATLTTGFEIGFVSNRDVLKNKTITAADVICSVRVRATSAGGIGKYEFKNSATGAYSLTTVDVVTRQNGNPNDYNDLIEWRSEKDNQGRHKLRCFVHQNGVGAVLLGEVNREGVYAADQYIGGFYSLYGAPTFNDLSETLYFPSFYNSPIAADELKRFSNVLSRPSAGVSSVLPSLADFNFHDNIRFRMSTPCVPLKENIMGFDGALVKNVENQQTFYDITDIDLTFSTENGVSNELARSVMADFGRQGVSGVQAPARSFLFFGSQNYIVELLNLPLNSFDSFSSKRGRANILAVIPQNEFNQGNIDTVLMYEPANMTYVGLTNKSELSLRNIRARIVYPDYTPISTVGMSSIVIHLKPTRLQ